MEVSTNEQESTDNYDGGIHKDKSRDGENNERFNVEEQLDTGNGTEDVEADLAISKLSLNTTQEISPLVAREEESESGGAGLAGAVTVEFEFHLPEEVWLVILNMVEDADRVNCCRAFPYLDSILTASKPVFLSEQVLPLMGKWLSTNELLNCRRVCNKWCVGIDQLVHSKRDQTLDFFKTWSNGMYKLKNQEEVDRFIATFSSHTRNPFIDGTVGIANEDMDEEYPEKVLQFLRQFGKHIRILRISDFCEILVPMVWWEFLQEALRSTPNLRQLGITGQGLADEEEWDDRVALFNHMIVTSPPVIPTLEVLWWDLQDIVTGTVQDILMMLVLPYADQLKALSVLMPLWKDLYATRLVNLSKFLVFDINSNANLRRLLHLTAPLKFLVLHFTGNVKVRVLLQVLKNFPTLETVSIEFVESSNNKLLNGKDLSKLSDLNVASVKSLKIVDGGTMSYNFLQMFTGLRRLEVKIDSAMDTKEGASREGGRDLQFFKFVEDGEIYDSNIWKLIPSLEHAEIEFQWRENGYCRYRFGTREGYNKYLSNLKLKSAVCPIA